MAWRKSAAAKKNIFAPTTVAQTIVFPMDYVKCLALGIEKFHFGTSRFFIQTEFSLEPFVLDIESTGHGNYCCIMHELFCYSSVHIIFRNHQMLQAQMSKEALKNIQEFSCQFLKLGINNWHNQRICVDCSYLFAFYESVPYMLHRSNISRYSFHTPFCQLLVGRSS